MHFHIALWERFGPFFRYFWDSLGFSGKPPQFISPTLGQFWPFLTTFGPFLDHFRTPETSIILTVLGQKDPEIAELASWHRAAAASRDFRGFWGFPVKTVCQSGLLEDASQQRTRYTTLRGSSQRPSRGVYFALPACPGPKIHSRERCQGISSSNNGQ